ncbi:hypothetical protein DL96DRAFT_1739869 [Flagelloscypha sp. PMI_526]|nr:hypothetical protein DL96DRAFT_1739869 [Flagelloscypha sp. PMI_526]
MMLRSKFQALYETMCSTLIQLTFTLFFTPNPHNAKTVTYSNLTEVKAFLNPTNTQLYALLQQRARANERLYKAFHLTNTFVSSSRFIHSAFQKESTHLLRNSGSWEEWASLSDEVIQTSLPSKPSQPFTMAPFIQQITLKVVIVGLLRAVDDVDQLSDSSVNIQRVTELIPQLWACSKLPSFSADGETVERLAELNQHLREIFPDENKYPNPLDFVIPTWETFWRVVATCLAEVQNRPNLVQIMKDFVENPTSEQFVSTGTNDISVEFIVLETLRLHPPVQRITRVVEKPLPKYLTVLPEAIQSWMGHARQESATADIFCTLRTPDIFGDDAEVFSPSRFYCQPALMKIADLAFGHGPIQCVAAKWAKRAAALLAASLLNHLDSHTYSIVRGNKIGGRDGWEGWVVEMRRPE